MTDGATEEAWTALIQWARERANEMIEVDAEDFDPDYELVRLLDSVAGIQPTQSQVGEQLALDLGHPASPSAENTPRSGTSTPLAAISLRRISNPNKPAA